MRPSWCASVSKHPAQFLSGHLIHLKINPQRKLVQTIKYPCGNVSHLLAAAACRRDLRGALWNQTTPARAGHLLTSVPAGYWLFKLLTNNRIFTWCHLLNPVGSLNWFGWQIIEVLCPPWCSLADRYFSGLIFLFHHFAQFFSDMLQDEGDVFEIRCLVCK